MITVKTDIVSLFVLLFFKFKREIFKMFLLTIMFKFKNAKKT